MKRQIRAWLLGFQDGWRLIQPNPTPWIEWHGHRDSAALNKAYALGVKRGQRFQEILSKLLA